MEYVIWGAGKRGKKALNTLGRENIICFVDSDPIKIGTFFEGKEVKSIDSISFDMNNYIILITPVLGQQEIIDMLKERNLNNYFLFNDCPPEINLDEMESGILDAYDIHPDFSDCAIYGMGWFSLLLYDLFNQLNIRCCLVCQKEISIELINCICTRYEIKELEKAVQSVQVLLDTSNCEKLDLSIFMQCKAKYISINDYLEKSIKFYNADIASFKNRHKGERCFIVATGPSLTVDDLEMLYRRHEKCISMNRIYNIFSRTRWRPDYYVIEDYKMIEDLAQEIAELPLQYKFVASKPDIYWQQNSARSSIKFNMITGEYNEENIRFSKNVEHCIYNGRTVTYACLQLAVYMGFTEIYLLGVDFNYSSDVYAESNHFEGYQNFYKDIRLNQVDPKKQLLSFMKAKKIAEEKNIKIINATRGGKLEIFERKNFDDLLKKEEIMSNKILIYGCGIYTRNTLENLDINYNNLDFTDSDVNKKVIRIFKKNGEILDAEILPSENIKSENYAFCIIGSKKYENEIKDICINKGFSQSRIISVDYIIGHWRRWEKGKICNAWRESVENENIKVIRNWHAFNQDMQCVLKIENAAFCNVEIDFLRLFNHKKEVEVWNICDGIQIVNCVVPEQENVYWDINTSEALFRIVVKNSLDEIPWCTVDIKKSDGRIAIEKIKRGLNFLNVYKNISSFNYYDEDYLALQRIKDYGTILDVGAQYGQSLIAFYQLTKSKIISIEPVPELYEVLNVLKRNIDDKNRVQIVNVGISDENGELIWYEPENPEIAGSFDKDFIYGRNLGVKIDRKKLMCQKLDDIVGDVDDIWFIKMDVEGLEYKAISGCMNTIKKNYPIILIEQNESTKEILTLLEEFYEKFYYNLSKDGFEKTRISALNCWLIPKKEFRNNIVKKFVKDRGLE